ncbi:hypothetical protein D3C73_1659070 [compost metagenome]
MKIISWLIAVLKRRFSKSSVTFLIVLCQVRLNSSVPPFAVIFALKEPSSVAKRRHTRDRKR